VKPYYDADGITLYLGDCRDVSEWLSADVLVCDPPYGIGWTSGQTSYTARNARVESVIGDDSTDLRDAALTAWGDKPAMVFGSWRKPRPKGTSQRLIWHKRKTPPGVSSAAFYSAEEEIYLIGSGWVGKPTQNVIGTDEWRASAWGFVARSGHPTPKPDALMSVLIAKCPPGVIADPFAGSGSTLVAAKLQGRRAIGVEIHEPYAEIAARRLSQGVLDFGSAS
jgi:site-specific DNA-methyltransferase (adenine-specific)